MQTNGLNGIFIVEKRSRQPLWAEWSGEADEAKSFSYFFEGRNVMDIHVMPGKPPRRDVSFYGEDGQIKIMWADRSGSGVFSERILYQGEAPRLEVWYREAWRAVDERGNKKGMWVGGEWFHANITNGFWVPVLNDGGAAR